MAKMQTKDLTPLQRASLVIQQLKAKVASLEERQRDPIAIVGMACRLPGVLGNCETPEQFWDLLANGEDAVTTVPKRRWDADAFYSEDSAEPGKTYGKWGSFLRDIDQFAAPFFGIAPREAKRLDPQQRMLLEVAWQALEHGGQAPDQLEDSATGIFVGIGAGDYGTMQVHGDNWANIDAYMGTGSGFCFASGRLSYIFKSQGPTVSVDTACSSSLVALHLACQSLRTGDSELALACGVNALITPEPMLFLSKTQALSPTGRCKTFDSSADGFVRGEGAAVLVLKRLSDAQRQGDNILAVIRGSAINHDGGGSGLTVPNKTAQSKLIRKALADAGLSPNDIDYVEAHGTGTQLGDPIEMSAIGSVFSDQRDNPLWVGSVKTNLGHLETAAGVSAVMKVVLALQNEAIPPHVHFQEPTPHIDWQNLPVQIPTKVEPWLHSAEKTRYAGVSSFGLSGTNAHIILSEAPANIGEETTEAERPLSVLALSAQTENALRQKCLDLLRYLAEHPEASIEDICYTNNVGRAQHRQRLSLVVDSAEALAQKLTQYLNGKQPSASYSNQVAVGQRNKIAFMFTGQGSQYAAMGRELYENQPVFRATIDHCAELLAPHLEQSLHNLLNDADGLDQTANTQPALFAIEYALAQLWLSWGVKPNLVMGHSVGEYVAACLAGVFSLEDGLQLIAARGRLMQALPAGGAMAAILTDTESVVAKVGEFGRKLAIAAYNGPAHTVISGEQAAVEAVCAHFEAAGNRVVRLTVSHAFHSPLIEPMMADFRANAATISYHKPKIQFVSNVTGKVEREAVATADYWVNHIGQPVNFMAGVQTLKQKGCRVFIEIGPRAVLLGMGRRIITGDENSWLPTLRSKKSDWQPLLSSVGQLTAFGCAFDWRAFDRPYQRTILRLPTYPFERQRYWLDVPPLTPLGTAPTRPNAIPTKDDLPLYQLEWQPQPHLRGSDTAANQHWLIFADGAALSQQLADTLQNQGHQVTVCTCGDGFSQTATNHFTVNAFQSADFITLFNNIPLPDHVIAIFSSGYTKNNLLDIQSNPQYAGTLHLTQAVARLEKAPRFWQVTRNGQCVTARDEVSPTLSGLWGFTRVAMLEQPGLNVTCIDFDSAESNQPITNLINELLYPSGENQIAYRKQMRYVARLAAWQSATHTPITIHPEAAYLITGGLGSLGLQTAKWLAQQGAKQLILTGRSQPKPAAQAALENLAQQGVSIEIMQADVSREADVRRLFDMLAASDFSLRGIIHAAGTVDDGILTQQTWQRFAKVLAAKVSGTWHLHRFSAEIPLDFFVCYSSIAALIGVAGQSSYATANAFMDGVMQLRRAQNLVGTSVNFGPWRGSAMTTGNESRYESLGVSPFSGETAFACLDQLLGSETAQATVLQVDWPRFLQNFAVARIPPLLSSFTQTAGTQSSFLEIWQHTDPASQRDFLTQHVREAVAHVMALDDPLAIGLRDPLFDLGIDSLMALEIKNRLQFSLGQPLRQTLLFDFPFLETLITHLLDEVLATQKTAPTAATTEQNAIHKGVETLTDDEAEALLLAELAEMEF